MRKLWRSLPGPMPVRVVEALILAAAILVGLFFLFEWAGDLLDSGGAIGV